MLSWQEYLESSPIEWLLEKENPSIRYFALRDLLDKAEDDRQVIEAKAAIPSSDISAKILAKQRHEGNWEEAANLYHPKYKATYWQVMTLGQLGMNRSDDRVQRACNYVLNLQLENGGFSSYTHQRALSEYKRVKPSLRARRKSLPEPAAWAEALVNEHEYSCLTGNVVAALIRLGYGEDRRVGRALGWLLSVQNSDGGWLCPYWKAHIKDKHSCFHGSICPLEAFSEVPEAARTPRMKKALERAVEFFLMHRLYKADHHGYRIINPAWVKFSFPSFYGYNVLRGLSIITKLGHVDDERLVDAVKVLIRRRRSNGTWWLDSSPVGRMHVNIEPVGKPSKWMTLNAMRVLKGLHQTRNEKVREALSESQRAFSQP